MKTVEASLTTEVKGKPSAATFAHWLDGRKTPFLSTNAGASEIAFQGWRNFKEAFAPELIAQAVEETSVALGRPVESCIDPFGGSGTTALASQFLGIRCTTIEVNPYLADLIEAKLSAYDCDQLIRDFAAVVREPLVGLEGVFPGAPLTFVEPGVKGRYLFTQSAARCIKALLKRIDDVKDARNRRLMRVLLGAQALQLSNVVVSGKGRRYRRDWRSSQADSSDIVEAFSEAVLKAIYEIRRYDGRASKDYDLRRGDSRNLIPTNPVFDMAVFSPPYPNSFDYTDVYNVELWICGYLKDAEANRNLRRSTLRSHVQVSRDYSGPPLHSATLSNVVKALGEVRSALWDSQIPEMVSAYFCDMNLIMEKLARAVVPHGRIYMVVGDSRYAGVYVPVSKILQELALSIGLSVVSEEPFRSMRTSPQQGGRPELLETLITLSR